MQKVEGTGRLATALEWIARTELMINALSALDSPTTDHHRTSQMMNQRIDEYIHDISVRFFPDESERREELQNVLDDLVLRAIIGYKGEVEAVEYKPDEVRHG